MKIEENRQHIEENRQKMVTLGNILKKISNKLMYPLAREGVYAPGEHVCLAHFMKKFSNIVDLTVLRLAFFMGYG